MKTEEKAAPQAKPAANPPELKQASINLSAISESYNPRGFFEDLALLELQESIRVDGVIQPIVVRPHPKPTAANQYDLVCGSRRFRACKNLKLETIPAVIRELTDDKAFDLKIMENLLREGVHPLDEAIAFKTLHSIKKQSVKDIAHRISKSEDFVARRLVLNDLSKDYQKEFYEGKLNFSQAFLIARLTPEGQKDIRDKILNYPNKDSYVGATEIQHKINTQIIRNLSSAPFKKDDDQLVIAAGACINCPKRSGANTSLFPDIKETDRCFDNICFKNKLTTFLVTQVKDILANKPEIVLLENNYGNTLPEIKKIAQAAKIPILTKYREWNLADKKTKGAVKGFYVNGNEEGTSVYVTLMKKTAGAASPKAKGNNIDQQIERIQQVEKSEARQDSERIIEELAAQVEKHPSIEKVIPGKEKSILATPEYAALLYIALDNLFLDKKQKKALGLNQEDAPEKLYKSLLAMSPAQVILLTRIAFLDRVDNGGSPDEDYIFRKIAETISGISISTIEKKIQEEAKKRTLKAEESIAALRKKKAEAKKKAAPPAAKKPFPKRK